MRMISIASDMVMGQPNGGLLGATPSGPSSSKPCSGWVLRSDVETDGPSHGSRRNPDVLSRWLRNANVNERRAFALVAS